MNEENKGYLIWLSALVLVVAGFSSCKAVIRYDDNKAIVKMVESGADPIAASCAVKLASTEGPECSIIAALQGDKQ